MTLLLVVDAERGALARILLVAERRGFTPTQLVATRTGDGFLVHLGVEGERDPCLLERMLGRLEDVRRVWRAPDVEAMPLA